MQQNLHPRCLIQANAQKIRALHERVHETADRRNESARARDEWSQACAKFHREYDVLAFPGGYEAGCAKLRSNDGKAIEDALAFLEVRPYFFRSQYIRTKLIRLVKRAALSQRQAERLASILAARRSGVSG